MKLSQESESTKNAGKHRGGYTAQLTQPRVTTTGPATFASERVQQQRHFHLNKTTVDISGSALHHLGDEDTGSALLTHNARQMIKKSTPPLSTHKRMVCSKQV